jgi:hypothetical protein
MRNLDFPNENLKFVTPPPTDGDARALAAVRAIEVLYPGERLWPVADDWQESSSIADRDRFVEAHAGRVTLSNRRNTRDERVSISFRDFGFTHGRSKTPFGEGSLELPEATCAPSSVATTVLVLGETFNAYWGDFTPEEARYALLDQVVWPNGKPKPLPFDLPPLGAPPTLASIDVPRRLGWINFWSPATCALLGFPDATRDARWLRGAKQGKSGAWVVRLTDDMLDPERNPEHVKALHEAYARFPEVGGRVEPR